MIFPTKETFSSVFVTADGKRLNWRAHVILFLLCMTFFLPGFFTIPPVDRDEPFFAQASKQMIETGNYTDIKFQNETRYKKPIGIYWLQAASVKLLSPEKLDEIWAYRIPSLVGATLSVLITAALGTLLFSPIAGFIAALLMACCIVLNVETRLAKADAALLACVMIAQYSLAKAYVAKTKECGKSDLRNFFLFWTSLSIGILIKGPIILLVTISTVASLRIIEKKAEWLRLLKPAIGLPYMLALTLPWFIYIMNISDGEFARASVEGDLFGKLLHWHIRGFMPPGLHLLAFPVVFFPSSLFALLAIPWVFSKRRNKEVLFCLSWIIPTWLIFEVFTTKLPHYVMPTYPAIAILAASFITAESHELHNIFSKRLNVFITCVWVLCGIGISAFTVALPYITENKWYISQIISITILVITIAYSLKVLQKKPLDSVIFVIVGSMVFSILTFEYTLPSLHNVWLSKNIVQVASKMAPCSKPELISSTYNEPSLVFLAGTNTQFDYSSDASLAVKSMSADHCLLVLIDEKHKPSFISGFLAQNITPLPVADFSTRNIGNGRIINLTLYRLPPPKP